MKHFFRSAILFLLTACLLFSVGCSQESATVIAGLALQALSASGQQSDAQGGSAASFENDLQLVSPDVTESPRESASASSSVVFGNPYTSRDDVAAYLHEYGELPPNFITKEEAQALGWDGSAKHLWEITDHKSIGGDYFGNYEGALPKKNGRVYHECDINFKGRSRGVERIVYSNDGLIYYTDDHYNTFTLLYDGSK